MTVLSLTLDFTGFAASIRFLDLKMRVFLRIFLLVCEFHGIRAYV